MRITQQGLGRGSSTATARPAGLQGAARAHAAHTALDDTNRASTAEASLADGRFGRKRSVPARLRDAVQ